LLRIVGGILLFLGPLATLYLNPLLPQNQAMTHTHQQLVAAEHQPQSDPTELLLSVAEARGEKLERVKRVHSMCALTQAQGPATPNHFLHLRMCQDYGFIKWEDIKEFHTMIRGRGDRDGIAIFQFFNIETYGDDRSRTAAHERSVQSFAQEGGYRHVKYFSCPLAESQQWDALAKGGGEGAQWLDSLKASGQAVSLFMQRILAVEYLLSDPAITHVLQLDMDVCIHELGRTLESVVMRANALPREKRAKHGAAPGEGGEGAPNECALIADMSSGGSGDVATVNAGVFFLKSGAVAAEFLREWRMSYLTKQDWNGDQGPMMNAMLRQGSRLFGGAPYTDECHDSACAGRWFRKFGLGPGRYSFGGVCLFDQADREQSRAIGNFHDDCPAWHGCGYRPGDFLHHQDTHKYNTKNGGCPAL
jgi:hypothetical protein